MTAQQALRHERRLQRELERREQARETVLAILIATLVFAAFVLAGTCDYQDEQRELAYWESRGVTVQRW